MTALPILFRVHLSKLPLLEGCSYFGFCNSPFRQRRYRQRSMARMRLSATVVRHGLSFACYVTSTSDFRARSHHQRTVSNDVILLCCRLHYSRRFRRAHHRHLFHKKGETWFRERMVSLETGRKKPEEAGHSWIWGRCHTHCVYRPSALWLRSKFLAFSYERGQVVDHRQSAVVVAVGWQQAEACKDIKFKHLPVTQLSCCVTC